ncbi:hypothetical protein GCM10010440_67370 [Kitasatospora cinereorecta]
MAAADAVCPDAHEAGEEGTPKRIQARDDPPPARPRGPDGKAVPWHLRGSRGAHRRQVLGLCGRVAARSPLRGSPGLAPGSPAFDSESEHTCSGGSRWKPHM